MNAEPELEETTHPEDPIFDEKPKWALLSKGILGPLFIILAMVLKILGIEFDIEPLREFVEVVLTDGTITVAAVIALIGRYVAKRKVVLWPTATEHRRS